MRDFWYTFLAFTSIGVILAAFVRFVFFLSMYGYTTKFLAVVALFSVVGVLVGLLAQRYRVVSHLIKKLT